MEGASTAEIRPVLLCSSLTAGGSAKAALRLMRALRQSGIDAKVLSPQRPTGEAGITGLFTAGERLMSTWVKATEIGLRSPYRNCRDVAFSSGWVGCRIARRLTEMRASVVNHHQCHNGFVSMCALRQRLLPLVWSIHDWWPITGGCHVPADCERHRTGCGQCPALGSRRLRDLSRQNHWFKRRVCRRADVHLVAVSEALRQDVEASTTLGGRPVAVVPNGLDLDVFRPLPKSAAREFLGLPGEARILLFGARRSDPNKGFAVVRDLARALRDRPGGHRWHVAVFGDNTPLGVGDLAIENSSFGVVEDELKLALLYSAADVTLVPSRQESFGLVAAESLACGTPVVAYRTTGLVDVIDHRRNGFLAAPGSSTDFIAGAQWVLGELGDPVRAGAMAAEARGKAGTFDARLVARRYIELYAAAMNRHRQRLEDVRPT